MMWQGIGGIAQTGMAGLGALGKANDATKAAGTFNGVNKTFDPSVYTPKSIYFQ
jgi:hypothetical protein